MMQTPLHHLAADDNDWSNNTAKVDQSECLSNETDNDVEQGDGEGQGERARGNERGIGTAWVRDHGWVKKSGRVWDTECKRLEVNVGCPAVSSHCSS